MARNRSKATRKHRLRLVHPELIVSEWMTKLERDFRSGVATAAEYCGSSSRNPNGPVVEALRRLQVKLLGDYSQKLTSLSRGLDNSGCWKFFYRNLTDARTFGVEDDLRKLVFNKAAEFAGGRSLLRSVRVAGVTRLPYAEAG